MLALEQLEANTCPGCGGWLPETTDPDTDTDEPTAHWQWHVDNPTRCHRCTAIARKREGYRDTDHAQALLFPAVKVPRGSRRTRLTAVSHEPEPWETGPAT